MNYDEFLKLKEEIKKENPNLIDYSENNLYKFFEKIEYNSGELPEHFYRCHIVEDYLKMMNLKDSLKIHIGSSQGVRESLMVLKENIDNWIIPEDVYPFYNKNIEKPIFTYKTLNEKELYSNIPDGTLLICYPLKPQGRDLTKKEKNNILDFLNRNKTNLLVIDMVYITNFKLPKFILDLYETNQVILLHSLSKMFLKPNVFGVTYLPKNELGNNLRTQFQKLNKNEEKLKIAYEMIHYNKNIPSLITKWILDKSNLLGIKNNKYNPSYLFYSPREFDYYIKKGILVIPATVFGGDKGSIISLLNTDKTKIKLLK